MGLLLSELGGYLLGFDKAPAGTKRISNLLGSPKWDSSILDKFLFDGSMQRLGALQEQGLRPLLLWDDSRLEKPESWFAQGLCSVLSSKGKRLTKVKRGFYRPPMSRICVPGFEWTAVILSALGSSPSVCQMSWWTTRGKFKELGTNIIYRLLKQISTQTKRTALHVMYRGYASAQILEWLFKFEQDFLIRWKKNHLLCCPAHEPLKPINWLVVANLNLVESSGTRNATNPKESLLPGPKFFILNLINTLCPSSLCRTEKTLIALYTS